MNPEQQNNNLPKPRQNSYPWDGSNQTYSQPYSPPPNQPKSRDKRRYFIISGILIGLVAVVVLLTGGKESNPSKHSLDFSDPINANEVIDNQELVGTVGDQIKLLDGRTFKVTKVQRNAEVLLASDSTNQPGEGQELMLVEVLVGSIDKDRESSFSPAAFYFKDASGNGYLAQINNDSQFATNSAVVSPGQQQTIHLLVIVPKNSKIDMVYSNKYPAPDDSREVALKATVHL